MLADTVRSNYLGKALAPDRRSHPKHSAVDPGSAWPCLAQNHETTRSKFVRRGAGKGSEGPFDKV